jgi:hypothetical protein
MADALTTITNLINSPPGQWKVIGTVTSRRYCEKYNTIN